MSEESKLMDNVNTLIQDTCLRLKLPLTARTATQIIYNFVYPFLSYEYSPTRMVFAIIFLASKISECPLKPSSYKNLTGFSVDSVLEVKIATLIQCTFSFFDTHGYIREICRLLDLKSEDKIEKIERIYSCERINQIGFIKDGYNVNSFCVAAFPEHEMDLFEKIFCLEVNRNEVSEIRRLFF